MRGGRWKNTFKNLSSAMLTSQISPDIIKTTFHLMNRQFLVYWRRLGFLYRARTRRQANAFLWQSILTPWYFLGVSPHFVCMLWALFRRCSCSSRTTRRRLRCKPWCTSKAWCCRTCRPMRLPSMQQPPWSTRKCTRLRTPASRAVG